MRPWTLPGVSALLIAAALAVSGLAVPVRSPLPARVKNWPVGVPGELRLTSGEVTLGTPVSPDGTFTLTPPTLDQVQPALRRVLTLFTAPTLGGACVGKGSAVPTDAQYAAFQVTAQLGAATGPDNSSPGGPQANVTLGTPPGSATPPLEVRALLLYFTRPTTLRGTVTCPDVVYRVAGTYHAGLVLVPLVSGGRDEQGRAVWTWTDTPSLKGLTWTLDRPAR